MTMSMATIFAKPQQLPHIPRVVQELIQSLQDEEIDVDHINSNVSKDQALTAKVLRLANSAHFGVPKTVANTSDAVMLLGFQTLRTMVLASGVTSSFEHLEGFDKNAFWKEAFAIGELSKWVGQYVSDCDKETAFTAGMLHSIGSLLMRIVTPDDALRVDTACGNVQERHLTEQEVLGFDYTEVGAELAKRWKFPQDIQDAIRDQNDPLDNTPTSKLAGILYIAKYLQQAHSQQWEKEQIIEDFPVAVANTIGMDLHSAYQDVDETDHLESGFDTLLND